MKTALKPRIIIKPRQLTIEDLKTLPISIKIQDDSVILERSPRGWKLRQPVKLSLEKVLAVRERGLVAYIFSSFASERPNLIPFVFNNKSLIRMARHFLRHCSGSPHSIYSYTSTIYTYSTRLGYSPDLIIQDVKPAGSIPDPLRVQNHIGFLEDYIAELQDEGLSPGRVNCYAKHIRTFYRVNGVKIELIEPLSRRVTYKDRSPKPEELVRVLEIAGLREKVIVSTLVLGAFREETLAKLQYRHVRRDMESNQIPIHVHVEAEITKGKYADYDTFLGAEAAEYLRLYLEQRRRGSPDGRNPPEALADESPLIRDMTSRTPRSIGSKQIRKLVHQLYVKAGLLKEPRGRMYELRVHSLRKYFKTQLLALGVQPDYVDYMMGHTVDTYHDIQMKGVDFLRNIYAGSGLAIKPKTKVSKIDALKEIIRAWGLNPEQILTREALTRGAAVYSRAQNFEDHQLAVLSQTLKQLIRQETAVQMRSVDGGPDGVHTKKVQIHYTWL
jgi:site-specific recombinase XerD